MDAHPLPRDSRGRQLGEPESHPVVRNGAPQCTQLSHAVILATLEKETRAARAEPGHESVRRLRTASSSSPPSFPGRLKSKATTSRCLETLAQPPSVCGGLPSECSEPCTVFIALALNSTHLGVTPVVWRDSSKRSVKTAHWAHAHTHAERGRGREKDRGGMELGPDCSCNRVLVRRHSVRPQRAPMVWV